MKNKIIYFLIILLIFSVNYNVNAKTLKDLKNELSAYEKEMSNAKNKMNLTKAEISNINSRVKTIRSTSEKDQENIKITENEIVVLEQKADEKNPRASAERCSGPVRDGAARPGGDPGGDRRAARLPRPGDRRAGSQGRGSGSLGAAAGRSSGAEARHGRAQCGGPGADPAER